MAKNKKLTPEDLISFIDTESSNAYTYNTVVSNDRVKALNYYNKRPFGNEKRGRSTYVSSEVQETIGWAIPQIMKIFSGSDIIKFDARTPESKVSAEHATEYARDVLYKQNDGFLILHNFFHDAMLQKNGFVKIYYDNSDNYEREEYKELSDIELTQIVNDPAVEVLTHDQTQIIDPMSGMPIAVQHDITIKRRLYSTGGKIKIENVPVEEVIVSKNTRSLDLDDCPFVAHRVKRTISWLREQGYTVSDDINDGTENTTDYSLEKQTRDFQDGNYYGFTESQAPVDPSMRLVWVTEAYFKVDYNNDGIAELRKITKVGSTILDNEEVHIQPFVSTSPFPQPHKFNGVALADLVTDLQLLKSMLMRAMLDSFAFNINPSKAVDISKVVDVNDLLDTNPGNFIRMRGDVGNAIYPIPSSGIGAETFNLLKYVDDVAESRSGVSKMTQGIDKNVFNKTATGTQAIMNASQEKLSLMARIFAETGLAPIYKKIIQLASKYSDQPELIQISNQYTMVNPLEWKHLKTININVGTGSLDTAQQSANYNTLLMLQEKLGASQMPELMGIVDPEKIFNLITDTAKSLGVNSPESYFNKPGSQEYMMMYQMIQQKMTPPPPQPDPSLAFVEVEKQKQKQDMLIKTAEFELDKLKADREFELKKYEMQLKYELELAKLAQNELADINAKIDEIAKLNPSADLLPPTELTALTAVLDNAGINSGQVPLYEQILAQKQQREADLEQQRQTSASNRDYIRQVKEAQDAQAEVEKKTMMDNIIKMASYANSPKTIIRDENGNIIGVKPTEE